MQPRATIFKTKLAGHSDYESFVLVGLFSSLPEVLESTPEELVDQIREDYATSPRA